MAKVLDGKKLSEKILESLKRKIKNRHLKLTLAVILVGKNSVSQIFINQKKKACQKVGIDFKLFNFSEKIKIPKLKKEIQKIVENPLNSGVIIQLPLPRKFKTEELLNLIPEEKDVDCLSKNALGKFFQGSSKILPPTVDGILRLLKNYKIKLKGKNVIILGAGRLVGLPLTVQLLKEKATVSVLNELTKNISFFTKKADILISGVGKPNLIKGKMIKRGAIVIDAGCSLKEGKLVGDVDFQTVSKKAKYLTPVPGGVGPMTVACLIDNLVKINY